MAWNLKASTSIGSTTSNTITSGAIDTTGADLIVLVLADNAPSASVISDSKGATWTGLAESDNTVACKIYYTRGSTVGSGHTFTATILAGFPAFAVLAFSGSLVSPFDQQNGATGSPATQPGSITPTLNGELVIAGAGVVIGAGGNDVTGINSGFTMGPHVASVVGQCFGVGAAYLFQGSAAAINPTFTLTGANSALRIASFKVNPINGAMFAVF